MDDAEVRAVNQIDHFAGHIDGLAVLAEMDLRRDSRAVLLRSITGVAKPRSDDSSLILFVGAVPEPAGGDPLPPNIRKIPFGDPPLKRQLGIVYQKSSANEKLISVLHNELYKLSGSPEFTDEEKKL